MKRREVIDNHNDKQDIEVLLPDYIRIAIRYHISLIRYKVGNFVDPQPKKGKGELDDKWLERITISQAQRFVNYYRDYTIMGAARVNRSNFEGADEKNKQLVKALRVVTVLALNKFDEYQRRIDQRVFEQKYKRTL